MNREETRIQLVFDQCLISVGCRSVQTMLNQCLISVGCRSVQTNSTQSNNVRFRYHAEIMAYYWLRERKCWTMMVKSLSKVKLHPAPSNTIQHVWLCCSNRSNMSRPTMLTFSVLYFSRKLNYLSGQQELKPLRRKQLTLLCGNFIIY